VIVPGCHSIALAFGALLLTGAAGAAEPSRFDLGADLGYALPAGSLERGSDLSDLTYGSVGLGLDGAYRWHPLFAAGLVASYRAVIPKLCSSGGDCTSSLGHDASIGVLGRWYIGAWGVFVPDLDLRLGYEWLTAKHADAGASSSRSFRGFVLGVAGHAQFTLSRTFTLGPFLELTSGSFGRASLDAPGVSQSRETDGTALHLWMALGIRAVKAW
jgi:hypothetical protein